MTSTDQVAHLHQQIADGIAALGGDPQWRALLALSARTGSRYSLGNTLLIGQQCPDATVVAGYQAWRKAGRHVRRGEHGIYILAPLVRRGSNDTTGPAATGDATSLGEPDRGRSEIVGFRAVAVFDISQTDGPPIPASTAVDGCVPDGLRDALTRQLTKLGYQVRYGDCRPAFGITARADRTVTILPGQSPAQDALTLAHELGHIACGHLDTSDHTRRSTAEIQAESVAYIITTAAGMDAAPASLDYIGTWARGDQQLIRDTAETVIRTARRLLHDLNLPPASIEPGPAPASLTA
ncbi:MAG: ImmA/IrrE family metallo-endopeptidase [Micromonosporaceae bacterium]|nr:ImmA/IrrE family metallo-endopeptidase [Micromonosporaceae bacterium]